jgi:PAS domain S-box-containing protein
VSATAFDSPERPVPARTALRGHLTYSRYAGLAVILIAALDFVGWGFGHRLLTSIIPDAARMRPNTAVCLSLLGIALGLLGSSRPLARGQRVRATLARACSLAVIVIAGLSLAEYSVGPIGSLDPWLLPSGASFGPHSGRISPPSSWALLLVSFAILLIDARAILLQRLSQAFAVMAAVLACVVVLGYVYGAIQLYHLGPYYSFAFPTALAVALLASGVLFARRDRDFPRELLSSHYGGLMARWVLPIAIVLPILLGWLRLLGQRAGWYDTEVGLALFAASNVLAFAMLIWFAARHLNRLDADRRAADVRRQQSLREGEARWRALVEASSQIVWTADIHGHAVADSPSWRAFTGQSLEKLLHGGLHDVVHPDDVDRLISTWQRAVALRAPYEHEFRLRKANGEWIWNTVRAVPVAVTESSDIAWVGFNTDISERKRAQALTDGQKQVLEMIARGAPLNETLDTLVRVIDAQSDMLGSILLLDADGLHLRHGAAPSLPAAYTDAIDGAEIGVDAGSCGTAAFTRRAVYVEDIANDPLWRNYKDLALPHGLRACWSTPILDSSGRVLGTFALYYRQPMLPTEKHLRLIDLAAQTAAICLIHHRQMKALRDSENRFRQLAESLPQLVWTCEPSGECDFLSRQWLEFTGVPAAEQLGFGWLAQIHPADREALLSGWRAAVSSGMDHRSEFRIRRHDGTYRWFETRATAVFDAAGNIIKWCGCNTDVTDRKLAEEAQLRSQKLEALGVLAGGIAHDFNNMLLVIQGNAQLAGLQTGEKHEAQVHLTEILNASERAGDLVRRILAFSRPQKAKHKRLQLGSVIEDALKLVRHTLPATIEIRTSLAADVPQVEADVTQIHQIIVNLATNAAHAIGTRAGLIEIRLDEVALPAEALLAATADVRPGRYARLAMRDNGCGMSRETLVRVFDPFFTTKPVGQGTGLGLSIVHGIVQSAGGAVTVESEPDKGTTFQLYFPAAQSAGEGSGTEASAPLLQGTGQHVLFVDDEEAVVRLATLALTRLGYRVTACSDATVALRHFRRDPLAFDAVVTDLAMPGLSGFDCAREILKLRPDVPIVLASGYVRPEDELTAKRIGIRAVVGKPAALEQLGALLAEILVKTQGPADAARA